MFYYNDIEDAKMAINRVVEKQGKNKADFLGEIITLPKDPLLMEITMVKVHIDNYGYFLTSLSIWNELKNFLK